MAEMSTSIITRTSDIKSPETLEEKEAAVEALGSLLGVTLPESYRRFLIGASCKHLNGLPVLGLPLSLDLDSAWGATELLRTAREDLRPDYVVIRLMDSRALCLDLRSRGDDDAPLVEIDLESPVPPSTVHPSFRQYREECERGERWIEGALRRIERHLDNARKYYDHATQGKLPFKVHDWRVIRSCVHDQVVGLSTIKFNESFNGLEVEAFIATDHPDYESGHGIRALMLLMLSDSYRNGGSMEIRFTRYDGRQKRRVPTRLPSDLLSVGSQAGVQFQFAKDGLISHEEAISLYASMVGLSPEVQKLVQRHRKSGREITVQSVSYLISSRLWSVEETTWLLLNFHRPEAVLFGGDLPEDRFNYQESVSYARAALAAMKLYQRLALSSDGGEGDCVVRLHGLLWQLTPNQNAVLDWAVSGKSIEIKAGETITVLPSPRATLPGEEKRIAEELKPLAPISGKRFLLYCRDLSQWNGLVELSTRVSTESIDVLILPFTCRELDKEIEGKMSGARILRK